MKKIIVPVDFSIYSENALKTAAFIAKKNNAEIIVLHRLELSSSFLNQSENSFNEQAIFYLKLTEKKFETFLDKEYLDEVSVTSSVQNFKDFTCISEMAVEEAADLIIMGSKGVSGLKEVLVGSNTEKIVRTSSVPVLVVKDAPVLKDFSKALFACDFSIGSVDAYKKAKTFLNNIGCGMQMVFVNTPGVSFKSSKEQREIVVRFLKEAGELLAVLDEVSFVSAFSVEEGVLDFAEQSKVDLIIMSTHGRSGLAHFLEGSISEDIANHSMLPIVTFKM